MKTLLIITSIILLSISIYCDNISVTCEYGNKKFSHDINASGIYTCNVNGDLKILQENLTIYVLLPKDKVRGFIADEKEILYFPNGIDNTFPNLTHLEISKSKLKSVTSADIRKFKSLEYLYLAGNELSVLTSDTFVFNDKLKQIYLYGNAFKFIDPSVFGNVLRFHVLDLQTCTCINKKFLQNETYNILRVVSVQCYITPKLSDLTKLNENVTSELRQIKSNQTEEIKNLKRDIRDLKDKFENLTLSEKLDTLTTKFEDFREAISDLIENKIVSEIINIKKTVINSRNENLKPESNIQQGPAQASIHYTNYFAIFNTIILLIICTGVLCLVCSAKTSNGPQRANHIREEEINFDETNQPHIPNHAESHEHIYDSNENAFDAKVTHVVENIYSGSPDEDFYAEVTNHGNGVSSNINSIELDNSNNGESLYAVVNKNRKGY